MRGVHIQLASQTSRAPLLVTAFPISVRGWSLSYNGHQHEAGLQALLGSSPP
jgi:hypothetical protein